jgi:uncharacterized protein YecT (DUF1311 family)
MVRAAALIATLAALATAGSVRASNDIGPVTTATYAKCAAVAATEAETTQCLGAELIRQEGNVAAAYKTRATRLGPPADGLLGAAQRRWRDYRDADCKAQMIKGGSAARQSWLTCMIRMTAARAVELETYGAY